MKRCWVEVSLDAIARNYRAVRDAAGPEVALMPVVKADAYRHGAVEVSWRLEQEGAQWLAVSNVEEGIHLRRHGVRARILVMADTVAAGGNAWREYRLTPVVHDLLEIPRVSVPYHLKIDTGMGRLGVRAACEQIARAVAGTPLEGIMTHFASSADYESAQTAEQMAEFERVLAALPERPRWIHQSSTNPVHFGRRAAFGNLVRPGYAVYGYVSKGRSAPEGLLRVEPALAWKARILLVKDVEEGARIGYGAMFRAPRAMRIGVIGAGYADGLPHRLSNKGQVIAAGKKTAILGAVSMDVTTIDLSHAPQLGPGDAVTLLGREGEAQIDATAIARLAGTISYSVLCGISARVERVFV